MNYSKIPDAIVPALCIMSVIVFTSFRNRQGYTVLNPDSIKMSIAKIDSARTIYEANYESSELYDPQLDSIHAVSTMAWRDFVDLCNKDKFEDAYDLYNSNSWDLPICMYNSNARCHFDIDVLKPMIYEFEPQDSADVKYLNILEMEHLLESYSVLQLIDGSGEYVPECYPTLTFEYGVTLTKQDRIDEALDLVKPYGYALTGLGYNSAYTYTCIALFTANIYITAGDTQQAIEILEKYKQLNCDDRDPDIDQEEYDLYLSYIDDIIKALKL